MKITTQICLSAFICLTSQFLRASVSTISTHNSTENSSEMMTESLLWFAVPPSDWHIYDAILKLQPLGSDHNDPLDHTLISTDSYFLSPRPSIFHQKNMKDYLYRTKLIHNLARQIPGINSRQIGKTHALSGAFQNMTWRIQKALNRGTYGDVFEVIFESPGKTDPISFAFKRLSHLTPANIFEKEIKMLNYFNGHSRFLSYYGTFKSQNDESVIVLELMDGDLTDSKCRYSNQHLKDIVSGMKALKQAGIFHGDLKAENILYRGNRAFIADLGGSAFARPGFSHPNVTRTIATNAPEYSLFSMDHDQRQSNIRKNRFLNDPYKADIFSLGITLIEKKHGNLARFAQHLAEKKHPSTGNSFKFWMDYQDNLIRYFKFHMIRKIFTDSEDKLIRRMIDPDPDSRISIESLSKLVEKI